ncbi:MAG: peptidyl-prolyl cis-trans isomerase [Gemmatimonadota bacterium]|jgi:parvulin-like peptidyl-prolyl isomerase
MMRQMRENTKWIMLATALAFVALMVFQWGMDVTGRSAGGLGEIGQVNGTPVMYEVYQSTYRQLSDQAQAASEEPLTTQQLRDLENRAFDQVVNQILISQELQRRGIAVSNEEILQAARFNPPAEIRQIFQGENGFDLQQYQQYINSPNADPQILQYIEAYFRDVIPRAKLLRQVSSGIFLTDQELWQRWRDQNETVEVRYIALDPLNRVPDEEVPVSEDEMRDYYDAHAEEFEVPAQATVKAVLLPKAPTAADSAASTARADSVAEALRGGADWGETAALESADQGSASQGGELGVITPGRLVAPVDSAAFQGPVGEVQGPIRSRFGYHILEAEERWGQDSVRLRHVLVPIERTDDSEIELLTRADSLEDLGEDLPLAEAAEALGLEVVDAQLTDQFAFVAGAGQVGEGADWAFEEAMPGDVSPVFETSEAFYALELIDSSPGGVLPFEEARATIQRILSQQKKLERAEEEGRQIVATIRGGTSLPDAAAENGLRVASAGPFARNDFVPGLGRQNAAVGVAFGLAPGEVSDVVTTENNAFILEQVARTPADSTQWLAQKSAQREQVVNQLQQQRLQAWLDGLRANADIVDRRAEVLQPAEEEPLRPGGGGFGF